MLDNLLLESSLIVKQLGCRHRHFQRKNWMGAMNELIVYKFNLNAVMLYVGFSATFKRITLIVMFMLWFQVDIHLQEYSDSGFLKKWFWCCFKNSIWTPHLSISQISMWIKRKNFMSHARVLILDPQQFLSRSPIRNDKSIMEEVTFILQSVPSMITCLWLLMSVHERRNSHRDTICKPHSFHLSIAFNMLMEFVIHFVIIIME